jgi:DNA-binding NarL/FixJ family response regulator
MTGSPAPTAAATTAKSRIFLVDDHAMFREGLRQLIERDPEIIVCGEAAEAGLALAGIKNTEPNLVIVDISLGGSSGIDLIKAIKKDDEDLPILVVSMHEESLYAERALRAGAMGYVMKHEPAKTVRAAIRKVLGGDLYLSEKMSADMLHRLMRGDATRAKSPLETLSDRELEVFRKLGQGKSSRQIAEDLSLTTATINSFRNRIKEKLQLNNSTELLLHAAQWVRDGDAGI